MKRFLRGCTLVGALLAGLSVVSAAPANFSGTWALNKGKSQGLPPQWENIESYTMTVTQDDQQLTVENRIVGGGRPGGEPGGGRRGGGGGFGMAMPYATYKLDGTETKVEPTGARGGAATLKAQWKDGGKALELTTTRSFNFQGNEMTRTTKERWELAEGGKVLRVKRTTESPRGTQEFTLVFSKQ